MTDATQETPHPFPVGAVVIERASVFDTRRWLHRYVVTRHFKKRKTEEFASVALRLLDGDVEQMHGGRPQQFRITWYASKGGKVYTIETSSSDYARRRFQSITPEIDAEGQLDAVIRTMGAVEKVLKARGALPSHLKPVMVCMLAGAAQKCLAELTSYLATPAPPSVEAEEGEAA